ncbi:hypothetical protein [Archangium sp.]|uniref:hypothetical protein n=1 Tax=Archangium sp. TaxID=1872627 RepID=UPI002EDB7312
MNREQFLTWSESVLLPCAAPGAVPSGGGAYRSIRTAPRQYLGVDVLQDGTLRVYLYSNSTALKERWLRLKLCLEGDGAGAPVSLDSLPPEARPRLYMRDNGEEQRGFFGFEWRRGSRDLLPEQTPLTQYVEWLREVARKG